MLAFSTSEKAESFLANMPRQNEFELEAIMGVAGFVEYLKTISRIGAQYVAVDPTRGKTHDIITVGQILAKFSNNS